MKRKLNLKKINYSIIIALIAVIISLGSTYFSYRETVLIEQQKEASVWPFLEHNIIYQSSNDSTANFILEVKNKGVGPAIIRDVEYILDSQKIKNWELGKYLSIKYPKFNITQISNSNLKNSVLAPAEVLRVIHVQFEKQNKYDSVSLWKTIQSFKYSLKYEYSSVYGRCWEVLDIDNTQRIEDCNIIENF